MTLKALLEKVERFDESGGTIVQGTSGASSGTTPDAANDMDTSGRALAVATGYPYTNPASGTAINKNSDVDVVSYVIPVGVTVLLDFAQVRAASELSWQELAFTLIVGDVANAAGGQRKTEALEALTRPLDRDEKIPLGLIVKGDKLLRITVTNNDPEAPHLAEARIAGWVLRGVEHIPPAELDRLLEVLLARGVS